MSGPQGPDHTQPWPGHESYAGPPPSMPESAPSDGSEDVTAQAPTFRRQPPAGSPTQPPPAMPPPPYYPFDPSSRYAPHQQPGPGGQWYPPGDRAAPGYRPQSHERQPVQPGAYGDDASRLGPPPSQGYPLPYSTAAQPNTAYRPELPAQRGPYAAPSEQGSYWRPSGPYGIQSGSPAVPLQNKRSKRIVLLGGGSLAVLVAAAVLVLGFSRPGFFVTKHLDVANAQTGVQQILTDPTNGYGVANVKDVTCNGGTNPPVATGGTFTCEVTIDGAKHQVTATFQDDSGAYVVGQPR